MKLRKQKSARFQIFSSIIFLCDLQIGVLAVIYALLDFARERVRHDFGSRWPDEMVSVKWQWVHWTHAVVHGGRACKKLKLTQGILLQSCWQYSKEVVYTRSFFMSNSILGIHDTFAIFGLLTFHQKSYDIRVKLVCLCSNRSVRLIFSVQFLW